MESYPRPESYPELAGFLDGCEAGELRIPRCQRCGLYSWPPRPRCRHCHFTVLDPVPVSGAGRVYSWVVVHRTRQADFTGLTPYAVVIGELAEDPATRLAARFLGAPSALWIGRELRAVFGRATGSVLPSWEVAP